MSQSIVAAIALWQAQLGIPDGLLTAIYEVESSQTPAAFRHEPGYRWLYDIKNLCPYRGDPSQIPAIKGCSRPTELMGQQTSWGPIQIMGATARELGYRKWFTELCGPDGIEMGARYLARLAKRYDYNWQDAIEAYNAGRAAPGDDAYISEQARQYVQKVLKHWRRLT